MTTRSQNQIYKPYTFTDGRVKYPPPRALIASIAANEDVASNNSTLEVV
jgi:hypothetical protein